jgi:hypothetical protein
MKKSDIQVGKTYWDRKKGLRKVVALESDGYGEECVEYALLAGKNTSRPLRINADGKPVYGCYMYSFQVWAKEAVMFGPQALNFDDYHRAFSRLEGFRNEELGWDGCEGKPASEETCQSVIEFLQAAMDMELPRPSLVMSSSGAVSAVWQDSSVYITATFCGRDNYIYIVISRNGESRHQGISKQHGVIGQSLALAVRGMAPVQEDEKSGS